MTGEVRADLSGIAKQRVEPPRRQADYRRHIGDYDLRRIRSTLASVILHAYRGLVCPVVVIEMAEDECFVESKSQRLHPAAVAVIHRRCPARGSWLAERARTVECAAFGQSL